MFQAIKKLGSMRKSCIRRNFWLYTWLVLFVSIWTRTWPDTEVEGCNQRLDPIPLHHAYWDKEWKAKYEHLSIDEQRAIARQQYFDGDLDYIYDLIPGSEPRKSQ